MNREIVKLNCQIERIQLSEGFEDDPAVWLSQQGMKYGLATLLAHADDGIIWGTLRDGRLCLSGDYFPNVSPPFRTITLRECRLFGPDAELHVWRESELD